MTDRRRALEKDALRAGISLSFPALAVSISSQKMLLLRADGGGKIYAISTGEKPPSNREGSNGTPRGWHVIVEKYGDGLPSGEVLLGRAATGKPYWEFPDWRERGYVITRILRLRGLEEGINAGMGSDGHGCDSYKRNIYIHGTCFEERIGRPSSAGCVTLGSADAVELYDICPVGTRVHIG
ncbi:MAG: L,D-transpeptidase [Puniceicoccales bacterium]|nr:L,D-transpeptidase [Puniceicoccales bacterium]